MLESKEPMTSNPDNLIISLDDPLEEQSSKDESNPIYATCLDIFYKYFHEELTNIVHNSEKYGWSTLKSSSLGAFIQEIKSYTKDTTSNEHNDLITIHYICRSFFDYNETYLSLSHITFITKIIYPNLVYIMIKYLYHGHKFINKLINNVFYDYKCKYPALIEKFVNSYFDDEDLIKTSIFYKMLGDQFRRMNPENVRNITTFYKSVIYNRFYYLFKKESKVNPIYMSNLDNDTFMSTYNSVGPSNRFYLYKKILYKLKMERMVASSHIQELVSYNFDIFKKLIIPNELQGVLYSSVLNNNKNTIDDDKYRIMDIYDKKEDTIDNNIFNEIRKLHVIYKLLRCVHIINSNPKTYPYNDNVISKQQVKDNIFDELYQVFKNLYCDEHVHVMLNNIAENFTNNILSGEYINLLTLNSFKIEHISFINQLRTFVRICLNLK